MKCEYTKQDCPHVDTSGMTKDVECSKCEHYCNDVHATGGLPDITYKQAIWLILTIAGIVTLIEIFIF